MKVILNAVICLSFAILMFSTSRGHGSRLNQGKKLNVCLFRYSRNVSTENFVKLYDYLMSESGIFISFANHEQHIHGILQFLGLELPNVFCLGPFLTYLIGEEICELLKNSEFMDQVYFHYLSNDEYLKVVENVKKQSINLPSTRRESTQN